MQGSNPFKTDRNTQYSKDQRTINKLAKKLSKRQKKKAKFKKPNPKLDASHLKGQPYPVFLASEYWMLVRQMVLKRDKNECRVCKRKVGLQVHHETYKHHFKEHEHLEDLITLCWACHKAHHYAQM